jgi:hypothetical protein
MPKETTDDVVAHTPDPEQYHELSEDQARAIGGKGTVIPSASAAGKTKRNKPNKIFIDPDDPLTGAGAVVIDLNNVDPETKKAAEALVSSRGFDEDATMAAYELVQEAQRGGDPGEPGEQGEPGEVTSDKTKSPLEENVDALLDTILPHDQAVRMKQLEDLQSGNRPVVDSFKKIPLESESFNTFSTPLPRGQSGDGGVNLQDIVAQQSQMLSLMAQMVQGDKLPEIEKEEPVMETTSVEETSVEETTESVIPKREAVDLLNESFAALKIPGLGPVAGKPKFRVIFNLGDAGTHTAWYHWVGTHGNGLFLIYDTRFEYGMQYVPPNLGVGRSIKVDIPDNDASYDVYSLDFVHPFGVFDIVNLVVAESPESGVPNTPMNDFMSSDYNELDVDLMKQIM